MFWKRRLRSFSIACITIASSCGVTSGLIVDGGSGCLVRCATRISPKPSPGNGTRPVSSSYIMMPSEYTSERRSMRPLPSHCSGLMYAGVPMTRPVRVLCDCPPSPVSLAMPKSSSLTKFLSLPRGHR